MTEKPVSYLQTDPRWGKLDYSAAGENTTIGASGCGPTAMAMVLATWVDKTITPKTECAWALAHGFKAPHQGTYYGYFASAGARHSLTVQRLNGTTLYKNSQSPCHAQAKAALDAGDLVIACMGPGNWTRSGHYVLVYGVQGDTIFINDPASTKKSRTQGSYGLFKQQVKFYWVIQRPETRKQKEEDEMNIDKLLQEMTDQQAHQLLEKANRYAAALPEPAWSQTDGHWKSAAKAGLLDGTAPERPMKRCEVAAVLGRAGLFTNH